MINRSTLRTIACTTFVATCAFAAGQASAQTVTYTDAQAARGNDAFKSSCAKCHGTNATGGEGPPLVGEKFNTDFGGKAAKALYEKMSNAMPYDEPGTLPKETYVIIMAHILKLNGVPAGAGPLVIDPPGTIPKK